jgi:toxin ParE1/3/4
MAARIFPAARARIVEMWDYTEKKWGEKQADKYVRDIVEGINSLSKEKRRWKPVRDKVLSGVFYARHRHHYIFFREFSNGTIGIISILHENMDIPSRLKEDAGEAE